MSLSKDSTVSGAGCAAFAAYILRSVAMAIFKEAFNRAGELKDTETQSRICLEIGKIYDDNDFVVQALNSYNKSLQYQLRFGWCLEDRILKILKCQL